MNEVMPVSRSPNINGAPLAPQNINMNGTDGGMANPETIQRQGTYTLTKEPQQMLDEMYQREGGLESTPSDYREPAMVGCMKTCGSCFESCTNEEITEGQVGVITEFGKFVKVVKSGAQVYNCCTQAVHKVDVVMKVMSIPRQKVLTKDGLQLSIDGFIRYQVVHPQLLLYYHADAFNIMLLTASGTLRMLIGQNTLSENLANQEMIKKKMATLIHTRLEEYGILIYDVEIERMTMDVNLTRAMATIAESEKRKQAKKVKAKANLESSKIFKLAADELSKNPLSLQLKYFDTLQTVAAKQSVLILRDTVVEELKKKNRRVSGI